MPLSWNEIRQRAIVFSREWTGAIREAGERQTFWNEFFNVFGVRRRTVATFEEPVRRLTGEWGYIDLFWPGRLLVEHKSLGGDLGKAHAQAMAYIRGLQDSGREREVPRWLIVSDFARIAIHDLEPEQDPDAPLFNRLPPTVEFPLADLHDHIRHFAFIAGYTHHKLNAEDPANLEATQLMCDLHDALEAGGYTGHELKRFLVRILFCLFADDNGIFPPTGFELFLRDRTAQDGSDLGVRLEQLFHVLNTEPSHRQHNLDEELKQFPYVNGELFAERLDFAEFNSDMRNRLLACCGFRWETISPAVFGSLFQSVMDSKERRQIGAHYTAEKNILKLIRSLFLDELRAECESIKGDRSNRRTSRLQEFHDKLARLRFFDPACGCGNFLVLTYRELRRLELEVLEELHGPQRHLSLDDVYRLSKLDVHQFYGIEIEEFPARIAEVALWLTDHQANVALSQEFGQFYQRLPLRSSPHIHVGNALRMDWRQVLPPDQYSCILGNPPFVGKHLMTSAQAEDMEFVWGDTGGTGVLDYVSAWYRLAAEYIHGTPIRVAFVSTNSITQGEQVGALWPPLFQRYGLKIHFAHRTFAWESEARGKAHVHVVIIGFGAFDSTGKHIYDHGSNDEKATVRVAGNISPYLIEGSDIVITSRKTPICQVPGCTYGNKPTDGGHLIIEEEDRRDFLKETPQAKKFIRPLLCAEEYLHSIPRWCLWLVDASPSEIRSIAGIKTRVEAVRDFRLASKKEPTREMAAQPTVFAEVRQPTTRFMVVPQHTSQLRRYIPFGYFPPTYILHNSCSAIPDATLYHFGILSSDMHMAWVKTVCGRIKSDYRYSTNLVYNNFPWPQNVTDKRRAAVETAAQAVLDVRAKYPASTLADLYDPLTMPGPLLKVHQALDRAVDRCYRKEPFTSDRQRVEHLFDLYEKITAPLMPKAKGRKSRR
ncbi:MAG: DNA methyltransferase [Phycisphaerales bacterium]